MIGDRQLEFEYFRGEVTASEEGKNTMKGIEGFVILFEEEIRAENKKR